MSKDFYIMTGGPGVGKTTLLLELQNRGYICIEETARRIIQEQLKIGGNILPWGNTENYRDLMLKKSVKTYLSAKNISREILFFDRGIPDTLAYSKLINLPVTQDLKMAVEQYRYNQKVFILPPWQEIYHTDNERKQDFDEAVKTFEILKGIYKNLDYKLIEVPKVSVKERAEFIIKAISEQQNLK